MDLMVSRDSLVRALTRIQPAVKKAETLLERVLLNVSEKGIYAPVDPDSGVALHLAATDLELSIQDQVKVTCTEPGTVVVPLKKLLQIAKAAAEGDLRLRAKDRELEIVAGRSKHTITGSRASDFPTLPGIPEGATPVRILASDLGVMLKRISMAITKDQSRFAVGFALMKVSGSHVDLVGTDGHRLAWVLGKLAEDLGGSTQLQIPYRVIKALEGIDDTISTVTLWAGGKGTHLVIEVAGYRIMVRQQEGSFPDYAKVVPWKNPYYVQVDRQALQDALKRAFVMSNEKTQGVRFDFNEGVLELVGEDPEFGQGRSAVDYILGKGNLTRDKFSLNGHYALEFLDAITDEKVTIRFKDEQTQVLLYPGDSLMDEDMKYRYVIMPFRG